MTQHLQDLADVVRSKNSGPFRLGFDVLFADSESYRRVKDSGVVNREAVARLLNIPEEDVTLVLFLDPAQAIKISVRREVPAADPGDLDVYGCQQFVPLLTLSIPDMEQAD